jgi:probable rRNA maturation factor
MIHYRNRVRASGVDARALKSTAKQLLREVDESTSSLSITLVGDDEIRALNRTYRGKDRPTDVLSFGLDGALRNESAGATVPERMLGDVVISVDTARRQAAEYDATLQVELYRLLIHGVLHVLGYDHERVAERVAMEAEERRLAGAIGMPWPYEAAP